MKTLLAKAQLTRFSRKNDLSVNFTFSSMDEISNEDFSLMDKYFRKNGWLAFKANEFDGTEMPQKNATVEGQKSPSEYLRSCLWAKAMALGKNKEEATEFYEKAMAGFAQAVIDSFPGK